MGNTKEPVFEELMAPMENVLLRMIYKKVGSADATREIYHEVYLTGLLKLHQLRDVEKFPGWIIAITRNAIRSYWRSEKRRQAWEAPMDLYDPLGERALYSQANPSAEDIALEKNEQQCLLDAIDSLDETDKIILSLIYYSHMPLAEIAEMLDMSLSSVKMRKKRALKKLKQKMENLTAQITDQREEILKETNELAKLGDEGGEKADKLARSITTGEGRLISLQ